MNKEIHSIILQSEKELINFRRELHKHPELSFEEVETTNRVAEELDAVSIPYKRMEPTGLLAEIKGKHPGNTILLRADMDALPVYELNKDLSYRSLIDGKMHACGHDAHTSMLLTAAKALNQLKEHLHGTVRLIFQPGEELGEGARKMVEQGAADGIDSVFGIHIWSDLEVGQVSCPEGPSFAAADLLEIDFEGQGGHAAMPHQTVDAAVMASQFVTNVQSIVAREVDPMHPAVVTIGMMNVGQKANIIAENAHLEGTVRTFDSEARDKVEHAISQYAHHVAQMYGGTATVTYDRKTEAVINESEASALVRNVAKEAFGEKVLQEVPPTMGAEDFGFYMTEVPGAFALVGARNSEKEANYAHHHGRFNIDEDALKIGAELYAQYAFSYLENNKPN
jgi:amidohydrolase